ncbi:hypothetical protein HDK90DRAFT_474830 [Phyllosticta capitalensis]|uniref:Uncharacterized protein n=1 Tax=Phyllosticta capitalensis TaxID=121624 RepID=A0ABR1Z5B6_9PEZI
MTIRESSRAISQAQEVKKLTQLAFFFTPLTFVVGIFGMNLNELGSVSIWVWIVTSACLLAATYAVLYFNIVFKTVNLALDTVINRFWWLVMSIADLVLN